MRSHGLEPDLAQPERTESHARHARRGPTGEASSAATPATALYDFINIEIPGSTGAYAYNINDGRLVTGDYFDASGNGHGFVWHDGSVETLDHPGSLDTLPSATNNLGVGVALYGDGTTGYAAIYSLASGTWTTLPEGSGMPYNYGTGINDLGVAVGIAGSNLADLEAESSGGCNVAWILDPLKSAYSFFSVPGAANGTCANGINDLGQAAGGFFDASGVCHGFLKDGESYTTFDVPGATCTGANQINNKGVIVGGWFDTSGEHGYVRSADGKITIVDVPGTSQSADEGINDQGDLCGFYLDASGVAHAYVALKR